MLLNWHRAEFAARPSEFEKEGILMLTLSKKLTRTAIAAASLALVTACSSGTGGLAPLQSASTAELRVAPGDKVRIAVQDLEPVSGDYTIDETGSISVPLIQQVKVSGMTYSEMEGAIALALAEKDVLKNPNVTVQPLELRPVYIMGEVRQPGEYAYRQGLTVFAAISMAGGYTYRAQTDEVAITRTVGDENVTGTADEDTPIMPGDRIRIYERWF
ncbi:polysaccharide biosynthesis/export family protein [Erythrobacter sp. MTPC3]